MDAEPHTRLSSALGTALFNASANESGDTASGETGTSRMTWFSATTPPCFRIKFFEIGAAFSRRF